MLPFAATTISILRASATDSEAVEDGYPATVPGWTVVQDGVRAVIGKPGGTFAQHGSLQEIVGFPLAADPCDLQHSDRVRDDSTGQVYVVKWCSPSPEVFGLAHMSAELQLVEGYGA